MGQAHPLPRIPITRRRFVVTAAALATGVAAGRLPISRALPTGAHEAAMAAYAKTLQPFLEEDPSGGDHYEFQLIQLEPTGEPALALILVLANGIEQNVRLFAYNGSGAQSVTVAGGSSGWLTYLPTTGLVCRGGNHSLASWDYLYRVAGNTVECLASMEGGYEGPDIFESLPVSVRYTAYGVETNADGYIAAVREILGFEPSLLFGVHIDALDPYNEWIPMGSRNPLSPSYALTAQNIEMVLGASYEPDAPIDRLDPSNWPPQSDPSLTEAYALYLAKLEEYFERYGAPAIVPAQKQSGPASASLYGCVYAQLAMLNGQCPAGQLLVAYRDETVYTSVNPYGNPISYYYVVEVWDIRNGELVLGWSGHEVPGHQAGMHYLYIDAKNGQDYLAYIYDSDRYTTAEERRFLADGTFGLERIAGFSSYDATLGWIYTEGDTVMPLSDYHDDRYDAHNQVYLCGIADVEASDQFYQDLQRTASITQETLALLRLGAEGLAVRFPSTTALAVQKELNQPEARPGFNLTFPITEDPASPVYGTYIRDAIWHDSANGRCLSFLTYAGTELFAYPSIDAHNRLSFTFRTGTRLEVHRQAEPYYLDAETPSYWLGDDGLWY